MQVTAILVGITPLSAPGFLDVMQKSRIGNGKGGFMLAIATRQAVYCHTQNKWP
jgi:hypothetical protein